MRAYFFENEDRAGMRDWPVGTSHTILVKDAGGNETMLSFRVTRNTQLGSCQRWIYGQVSEPAGGCYEQVEIRLHKECPEKDTIEVYPQAPPVEW